MNALAERAFAPNPPLDPDASPVGWRAALSLGFERRDAGTVLVRNRHLGPLRVQKALYPEGEAICHAIVLHPPAGLVGGDSLSLDVEVSAGAHALLTTPGAGKWYRSNGLEARMRQLLRVADGARCEWLPQESIVYDGARGMLGSEVLLDEGARFIGMEMVCLGRTASGEAFDSGAFALETRIRHAGRSVWLERGRLAGGDAMLSSAAGLAGQPVFGTMVMIGPGADEGLRDACREIVAQVGNSGVTLVDGVLVARWMGPAVEPGRAWFRALWALARPALMGVAMREPRIWRT